MSKYKETTGYIIHSRPFKNSSLLLEFFSYEYGLFSLVAKGIKKNKNLKAQIHYFALLKIQFYGKSSLKTLCSINTLQTHQFKTLIEKTSAMYFNELIHLSLAENETAHELYSNYEWAIKRISSSAHSKNSIFRKFEETILIQSGFALDITPYADEQWLEVCENQGIIKAQDSRNGIIQAKDIRRFKQQAIIDKSTRKKINKLYAKLINLCVSHRKIYTRELLIELYHTA